MGNDGALEVSKLSLEEAAAFIAELDSGALVDAPSQCGLAMHRSDIVSSGNTDAPIASPFGSSLSQSAPQQQSMEPQQHIGALADSKLATDVQKPKKKRVRRQKLELDYLRGLVDKLESKMAQIKTRSGNEQFSQKGNGSSPSSNSTPNSSGSDVIPAPTVWKSIAERQLKERTRAEEQNRKLRASLEGQLKLASKLERLLRKRPRDEEVAKLADMKRIKPDAADTIRILPTDDEIFADQMAHVEQAHVEMERLFQGAAFADREASFSDMNIENDATTETGVAFVSQAGATLPFAVEVCSNAIWRAIAIDGIEKTCYYNEERERSDSLIVRSYGLLFTASTWSANVRGKHTFRRYMDADNRAVLMWKSLIEPVQLNGTKFHGLQAHQAGWIRLENKTIAGSDFVGDSTTGTMASTGLQSYARTTLELQDNIVDQEFQVGMVTDFVVNSHETTTALCGKLIQEFLVEEDWNMNGWLDNLMTDVSVL